MLWCTIAVTTAIMIRHHHQIPHMICKPCLKNQGLHIITLWIFKLDQKYHFLSVNFYNVPCYYSEIILCWLKREIIFSLSTLLFLCTEINCYQFDKHRDSDTFTVMPNIGVDHYFKTLIVIFFLVSLKQAHFLR